MFLNDAAFGVEEERSGEGRDSAISDAEFCGSEGNGIIDFKFVDEFFDGVFFVFVNNEADDLEAALIFFLKLDEVGDFRATRSAPGRPEIQENHFSAVSIE